MQQLHGPQEAAQWLRQRVTGTLQADSRKLLAGDGFLAWPGAHSDGRAHVAAALAQGVAACLVEHVAVDGFAFAAGANPDQLASYVGLKTDAGRIAAAYFDQPSSQLDVIAVTGTNGKTSTAWWLAQALSGLRQVAAIPCGLVGTLGVGRAGTLPQGASVVATGLTTPDAVLLQRSLRQFADQGLDACAMEASSIGLAEQRLAGTRIRCAVFTNFTQDHLDYHGSMHAYWQAKRALFAWPGLGSAVVNVDDAHGAGLAASLAATGIDLWTVSTRGPARLCASDVVYAARGLRFTVRESADSQTLQTSVIGEYNVSNLLGVMAAMRALGVPLAAAVDACGRLSPVPGRMECLGEDGQPLVAVDYAHTPDALDKALQALRSLATQRRGQLWCVFGCGGDRDPVKRPLMGAVAARYADRVVVTSDNPRSERPQAIVSQILLGTGAHAAVAVQVDRALAIAQCVASADDSDVLLVAGKGHEDYQEVEGVKLPFSDRVHVAQALQQRSQRTGARA